MKKHKYNNNSIEGLKVAFSTQIKFAQKQKLEEVDNISETVIKALDLYFEEEEG